MIVPDFRSRHGVSILIRTKNSAPQLSRLFPRLKLQSQDQLIVVDDDSTDNTISIAQTYGATVLSPDKPFHYSKSLNIGIKVATNDWIWVLSAHCLPYHDEYLDNWRKQIARAKANVVCICGGTSIDKIAPQPLRDEYSLKTRELNRPNLRASNANSLYRSKTLIQHPFNEHIPTAEDIDWAVWATTKGYKLVYDSSMAVQYRHPGSLLNMYRKGVLETRHAEKLTGRQIYRGTYLFKVVLYSLGRAIKGKAYFCDTIRALSYQFGTFIECRKNSF